ncbi:MAG: AraC family transcriptional regulator [Lentisphaerae bacterium]|nr:MAG: AraC family transcriptional regulator [Lentisphaerota bacterium]
MTSSKEHGRFYFAGDQAPEDPDCFVRSLGIHELMPPGMIAHGGPRAPILIIAFHSPAIFAPGGEGKEERELCSNVVIWPGGAHHYYGHRGMAWDHSWINIAGRKVDHLLETLRLPGETALPAFSESVTLRYLEMIYDELTFHGQRDHEILFHMVELWFLELVRILQQPSGSARPPSPVIKAKHFIESHYRSPITLAEIAGHAALSPNYLVNLFKKHYGTSPGQYLLRLRLERARELMYQPDLRIGEVARLTGFVDQRYFSRMFRRYFGTSPSEYRENHGT